MTTAASQRVLLAVRHIGNARVLAQAVAEIDMTAVHAVSESELNAILTGPDPPGVALVDTSGFGQDVWLLCHLLHEHEIPFVVMSAARDRMDGNCTLTHGAVNVLEKPVAKKALLRLLQSLCGR